ncbi:MAG: histidine phosphatase family protein [Phycisphaerales bacterium]
MMLIAILRHAKAEKQSASGRDEDRVLSPRGERRAGELGGLIAGVTRNRRAAIVSSRAARTRQTGEAIAAGCGLQIAFEERLFIDAPASVGVSMVEERVREQDLDVLVLVGHNNQVSEVAGVLVAGVLGSSGRGVAPLRTGEGVLLKAPTPLRLEDSLMGLCEVVREWRRDDETVC